MIHESQIRREYGRNVNVIRKGDSAWRNPDRVSAHSHEVSGEPGFRNPLSKMGQKLLQHDDAYRPYLDDILSSLPEHEVDAMDEISVSDGRDVVKYVKVDGHWRRRSISRNAAL